MNLLEVKDLCVWDKQSGKVLVDNSSFHLKQGSCLAVVGESGSGKSVTCRAMMRLNRGELGQSGRILFKGEDLNSLSEKEMRRKRGRNFCMILQNGMGAFDPSRIIGVHVRETLSEHFGWGRHKIELMMKHAMERVMLKNPIELMRKYPHQLSGGMLQRIMIALAIVLEPDIMIADEPTTALDAISQYEVVNQFVELRESMGCAMIFVSHDLGAVQKISDEVLVMKAGEIVEQGDLQTVFSNPQHAYTKYLVTTNQVLSQHFQQLMGGEVSVVKSRAH